MHSEQRVAISIWNSRHTKNPKKSMEAWKLTFMGTETNCRRPRNLQKNHSVLIKDASKEAVFTDTQMTALLQESFPVATARRFVKKNKSTLITVKIDFPN